MFPKSLTIFLEGGRVIFATFFPRFCYLTHLSHINGVQKGTPELQKKHCIRNLGQLI